MMNIRGMHLGLNRLRYFSSSLRTDRLLHRDHVLRTSSGNVRIAAVNVTNVMLEGKRRWEMTSHQMEKWGCYMAGNVLLSSLLKGEERIKSTLCTPDGQEYYAESLRCGEVRGNVIANDNETLKTKTICGLLRVQKILYGAATPYETVLAAVGDDASADWTSFYKLSEQIPTQIILASSSSFCGGLLLQQMPPSSLEEKNTPYALTYDTLPVITPKDIVNGMTTSGSLAMVQELLDPHVEYEDCTVIPYDFFCRCTKKASIVPMSAMSPVELEEIVQNGGYSTTCQFCNTTYDISKNDLEENSN